MPVATGTGPLLWPSGQSGIGCRRCAVRTPFACGSLRESAQGRPAQLGDADAGRAQRRQRARDVDRAAAVSYTAFARSGQRSQPGRRRGDAPKTTCITSAFLHGRVATQPLAADSPSLGITTDCPHQMPHRNKQRRQARQMGCRDRLARLGAAGHRTTVFAAFAR